MVKIDEPETWVFPAKINYKPNDNIFKGLNFNTAKKQQRFNREIRFFQQYSKEFNPDVQEKF